MKGRRYGGFWRRLFAFLIDKIILYFISLILFLIGVLALGPRSTMRGRILAAPEDLMHGIGVFALLYLAVSLLAAMAYFTWFHGIAGRTPGKMLLGLRVIQASGDPITPGVAFLRWVGYLISGPVFCLGFLWVAFDGRKQGWHDMIAATLVIREENESAPDAERNSACNSHIPAGDSTGRTATDSSPVSSSQLSAAVALDPSDGEKAPSTFGAAGMSPSAGEQNTFIPPPEQRQESIC
jgi:uncharacterized RDD family membrane protein YckC